MNWKDLTSLPPKKLLAGGVVAGAILVAFIVGGFTASGNPKVDAFLLRGLEGARAEISVLASCFNVARLIGILGVNGLIERLRALGRPCFAPA